MVTHFCTYWVSPNEYKQRQIPNWITVSFKSSTGTSLQRKHNFHQPNTLRRSILDPLRWAYVYEPRGILWICNWFISCKYSMAPARLRTMGLWKKNPDVISMQECKDQKQISSALSSHQTSDSTLFVCTLSYLISMHDGTGLEISVGSSSKHCALNLSSNWIKFKISDMNINLLKKLRRHVWRDTLLFFYSRWDCCKNLDMSQWLKSIL